MKTSNFPGRKNERRARAIERMKVDMSNMEKVNIDHYMSDFYAHYMITALKSVIANTERNIEKSSGAYYTKKNRSARARI